MFLKKKKKQKVVHMMMQLKISSTALNGEKLMKSWILPPFSTFRDDVQYSVCCLSLVETISLPDFEIKGSDREKFLWMLQT